MKLKQVHVRSPQDDEDLSCILVKPELTGNENETNNPEAMDYLVIPTSTTIEPQSTPDQSDLIHQALLQTTNELTSLLSRVHSNDSQVIFVENHHSNSMTHPSFTPEKSITPKDSAALKIVNNESMMMNSQYFFGDGNIVLLNQNTQTKEAEKYVANIFMRKYLKTWYQVYQSHCINQRHIKKLVIKEWKKQLRRAEGKSEQDENHSQSTETMMITMNDTAISHDLLQHHFHSQHQNHSRQIMTQKNSPGGHSKVLVIDISAEELNSLPSQLVRSSPNIAAPITIPTTIEVPANLPMRQSSQIKHQAKQSVVQASKLKEAKTPNNQKYRYYVEPTVSSLKKNRSGDSQASVTSTIPSTSSQSKRETMKIKYPNLQQINNYMTLYEQQEKQQQNKQLKKPKKLYKTHEEKLLQQTIQRILSSSSDVNNKDSDNNPVKSPTVMNYRYQDSESAVSSLSSLSMMKDKQATSQTRRLSTNNALISPSKQLSEYNSLLMNAMPATEATSPKNTNNSNTTNNNINNSNNNISEVSAVIAEPSSIPGPIIETTPSANNTPPSSLSSMMMKTRQQPQTDSKNQNHATTNANQPPLLYSNNNSYSPHNSDRDNASLCNIEPIKPNTNPRQRDQEVTSDPAIPVFGFGRRLKEKMQKYNNLPIIQPTSIIPKSTTEAAPSIVSSFGKPIETVSLATISPMPYYQINHAKQISSQYPTNPLNTNSNNIQNVSLQPSKLSLIKSKVQQQTITNPLPSQYSPQSSSIREPSNQFEQLPHSNQPNGTNLSLQQTTPSPEPKPSHLLISPQQPLQQPPHSLTIDTHRQKTLQRSLSRLMHFTRESAHQWEREQQASHYHYYAMRRRFLRKLRNALLYKVVNHNKQVKQAHQRKVSYRVESEREREYEGYDAFDEKYDYDDRCEHVWGDDSFARKYGFMKWQQYHQTHATLNQREDDAIMKIERKQLSSTLSQWRSYLTLRKQVTNQITAKLSNSPTKPKYFTFDHDHVQHHQSHQMHQDHDLMKTIPKDGSPSLIFADMESFHDHNNEEEEDSNTLSFYLDDDDSIYLSTTSSSENDKEEGMKKIIIASYITPALKYSELLTSRNQIPIFLRKRISSLVRYYQSYRYSLYNQQVRCIRLFFVNAIRRRLKRQLTMMAVQHYHGKLLTVAWYLWREGLHGSYATSSPSPSEEDEEEEERREEWSRDSSLLIDVQSLSDGYESYGSDTY